MSRMNFQQMKLVGSKMIRGRQVMRCPNPECYGARALTDMSDPGLREFVRRNGLPKCLTCGCTFVELPEQQAMSLR